MYKIVVLGFFCLSTVLFSNEYDEKMKASLYEQCKADTNNKSDVCQNITLSSFLQYQNNKLIRIEKDMWETTSEFQERKKSLEKILEQEIIKAIYDEMVDKGSGTVTIKSYNADTELMKLSLEWDNIQIRNIFSSKELAQEVTLKINRKDGKKIFNKDRTHRFDITVKYISHKLRISEIYLKNGDEKYILSSSKYTASSNSTFLLLDKWITPTESIYKSKGGQKIGDGVYKVNWENAKKICSKSGGRLPTIDELRKVVINCGGKMKYDNSKERAKNLANKSYQSCYKAQGFSNNFYWSSMTHADSSDNAWGVNFSNGNDNISYHKNDSNLVRCLKVNF